MLFFYSYEAALTSVNSQFIFNIIPDISALKMCRGALLQLAAPICTPEMLHCTDTFMFPGVIIPFWNTKQCYESNRMSLLYYRKHLELVSLNLYATNGMLPCTCSNVKASVCLLFERWKRCPSLCKHCILLFWQSPFGEHCDDLHCMLKWTLCVSGA